MSFQKITNFCIRNSTSLLYALFIVFIIFNEVNLYKFLLQLPRPQISVLSFAQRCVCYGSFALFLYLSRRNKGPLLRVFSLALGLTSLFYAERLIQPYLFQDDYYHYLAIIRGHFFDGLFIPFVDHVSPIWRLVQFLNLKAFGTYFGIATLPFIGATIMALSATALYFSLSKLKTGYALLFTLLLISYPGYRSILFWISTNAIALSSIFGIFTLYFSQRFLEDKEPQRKHLAYIFFLSCLSFFSWTTGLVYPIFVASIAVFNFIFKTFFDKDFNFKRNLNVFVASTASLGIFTITRIISYKVYTPKFTTNLLWIKNGLEHGYEQNFFRPFVWPFLSVIDSLLLRGGFNIEQDFNRFWFLLGSGVALCALVYLVGFAFKNKYLIYAYNFAFLSFAVVFVKRGMGSISHTGMHGYTSYAIQNDWYRISAWAGVLFFLALALSRVTSEKLKKTFKKTLVGILVVFMYYSLHFSTRVNHLADINLANSSQWAAAKCVSELPWPPAYFYYASANIFAPMRGANPGNYWLGYEPSWFDIAAAGNNADIKFDINKSKQLINDINHNCSEDYLNDLSKKYAFSTSKYSSEMADEAVQLQIEKQQNLVNAQLPNSPNSCPWSRYQLLEIKLSPIRHNTNSQISISLEKEINFSFELAAEEKLLTLDLRVLPPDNQCNKNLALKVQPDDYEILSIKAIRYLDKD
ncbi:MAG: hypothetical protein JSU04_08795 [Bdellovibrionales bacterium]|nr:hypothetical protein [Bdellovibrionales bacterium]